MYGNTCSSFGNSRRPLKWLVCFVTPRYFIARRGNVKKSSVRQRNKFTSCRKCKSNISDKNTNYKSQIRMQTEYKVDYWISSNSLLCRNTTQLVLFKMFRVYFTSTGFIVLFFMVDWWEYMRLNESLHFFFRSTSFW